MSKSVGKNERKELPIEEEADKNSDFLLRLQQFLFFLKNEFDLIKLLVY
jgi:hypothetical protein